MASANQEIIQETNELYVMCRLEAIESLFLPGDSGSPAEIATENASYGISLLLGDIRRAVYRVTSSV
jgi:hypothetical protein